MVLTPSVDLAMGSPAVPFTLINVMTNQQESLESLKGPNGTVIAFICNHCPFVRHIDKAMAQLANQIRGNGVAFIGISANDVADYPEDGPEHMRRKGYPFPYLYDESQAVAKSYRAQCTPDIYLYDKDLKLFYHGQFDNSRPGKGTATGETLNAAVEQLLAGKPPPSQQKSCIGCNIKWK